MGADPEAWLFKLLGFLAFDICWLLYPTCLKDLSVVGPFYILILLPSFTLLSYAPTAVARVEE